MIARWSMPPRALAASDRSESGLINPQITVSYLAVCAGQVGHPVRKLWPLASVFALIFTTSAVFAQSPYSGMQARSIKALSDQQVADLKAGRGMGLALAAELNGYPGPSHVLELADKLGLSAQQRTRVQELFDSMKAEAVPIGARLIEQEAEMDRQFATHTITLESLRPAAASIATTQGELRESHLKYHLATASILTSLQMQQYSHLRGYGEHDPGAVHHRN